MLNCRALILLAGELVALALFAILGRNTHNEAVGFEAAQAVTGTAAPFLIGWLITSLLLGARRPVPTPTVVQMVRARLTTWIVAYSLAMLVRGISLGRTSPLSFYIVAFTVPLPLLLAWRLVCAVTEAKRAVRGPANS
jgi:hypothetical protein